MTTVSVIVPAYNASRFLTRTLESICGQTHTALEIVVVDDGSTDDTAKVAANWSALDPRVRLVRSDRNRGLAAARNLGLANTRAEWVSPCDADDLWHPRKIELQLECALARGPELGGVYGWSDGIDDQDRVILPGWARHTAEGDVHHEMIVDSLPGSGSAALLRRSCVDAVGGFPEALSGADEWPLYIAIAARWQWAVVPQALTGYRIGDSHLSSNYQVMEGRLDRTTQWIRESWPDLPDGVLRSREHIVRRYLSFLALRGGHVLDAIRYRMRALAARPERAFTMDNFGFLLLCLARPLGLRRYYFDAWRTPRPWGAKPTA